MEKPELIKRGIYKKVAQCTSPNLKKSKLQNVQEKIGKLKEIRSPEKIFNGDNLKPSLRKSMLVRAVQSTEKFTNHKDKHIISSTPHHTKSQNGQPFFEKDFSIFLSPIALGRLSNNKEVEEKNPDKSDSSSEIMSPAEKSKSKIRSPERCSLPINDGEVDNAFNEVKTSLRMSKRDQSTNRSKVNNDPAMEINKTLAKEPTDKSPEKLAKKSPSKMLFAEQGDKPKSRIPLRLASHEKNEVHKPRTRIFSRSMTETPKKHDLSTNNQDVRDEDKNKKPGDKRTRRSISLSPKSVCCQKENVKNQMTFERDTEVALGNVTVNLQTSKRVVGATTPKETGQKEENKTITPKHTIVTRSGSRRVQPDPDKALKNNSKPNQQGNSIEHRDHSPHRENEFVNMTPRRKNNDTLILQGLPDPDSDRDASVILVIEEPSRCEKTNLGNKSRPSALRCQHVDRGSSVFAKSIGLSPIIIQTNRRDTTILHNTEKEKSIRFHQISPFMKSNVNTSNSYNNKETEGCALIITDNLSHIILPEKRTELNQSNRIHKENSPKKKRGDEKNKGDGSSPVVKKRIIAKTNETEKVTKDIILESDGKDMEPDIFKENESLDTENINKIIKNSKRHNLKSASKNSDVVETYNNTGQEGNDGSHKHTEGNNLNVGGKANVYEVQEGNKNEQNKFPLLCLETDDVRPKAIINTKKVVNRKMSILESINKLNEACKGSGNSNAAAKNNIPDTEINCNKKEKNKSTDKEQDAISVLCSEISAKKRETLGSVKKINTKNDNNDLVKTGERRNRSSVRVRRTVNRKIQTSIGFARRKTSLLRSRFIEQMTQTSQNSLTRISNNSSEGYPVYTPRSYLVDESSTGAGSDIIRRTMNAPRLASHNIFESLLEGHELDDWTDTDNSDHHLCHYSLSPQPWRFENDNLVPEQSDSVNLNFIHSEYELRRRNSANNKFDFAHNTKANSYTSDNSDGLTLDNMVSEVCKAPTTRSSRYTTAASKIDVDAMLSRTERRQYKKKHSKEVFSPEKSLSVTLVSKTSKNYRNHKSSQRVSDQRSPNNTRKTPTKYSIQANKYNKNKSSQRTSPQKIVVNNKYISQQSNAENTSDPLNGHRNMVFSSGRNLISLSPTDQQLLGVKPISASESETNNLEDGGRFTRGKQSYLNKNQNRASTVEKNIDDAHQIEKESEFNNLDSSNFNIESRGRCTRGKQSHSNKNQNCANIVDTSNKNVAQQNENQPEISYLESSCLNAEQDGGRLNKSKRSYSNKNQNRANTEENLDINDVQQNENESEMINLESSHLNTKEDRGGSTKGKRSYSNKNENRVNTVEKSNKTDVDNEKERISNAAADTASSNSNNIDKESNQVPATSAPSNTIKSGGRQKRTKKQGKIAVSSVQLDESNNNQTSGDRRSQRTRKPVRYLTDLKLEDYMLVEKRKKNTKGKIAKSSGSNEAIKENVEVKEKAKRKTNAAKQKIVETQETDTANDNLDVNAENDFQTHNQEDVGVPSLHDSVGSKTIIGPSNSRKSKSTRKKSLSKKKTNAETESNENEFFVGKEPDENQPPIEPPVNNESAVSPNQGTSLGTLRVQTNFTSDSGFETINGINRTTKRNTSSKIRIGGKKRHIETGQNENANNEPATESTDKISSDKSLRSGESSKKHSAKGKSNKKVTNYEIIEPRDTDAPNDNISNNPENDFNKISEIPVTSQEQEGAISSPRYSLEENQPSNKSRVGQPVTENECMPPPNGCSTINFFGASTVQRRLSGDSGFETASGITRTTRKKYSTRIRTTAKKKQVHTKPKYSSDVIGDNQPDNNEVPESASFAPGEHNMDTLLFQVPSSTILGGVSKTHKKQNLAKDVTNRVSRALERASESFRTLDQSTLSQRFNETRNNGSRRNLTGFSDPISDDHLNCNLNGQLYLIKYANQLPLDSEYKRIGDVEVTQTLKFPKNDITAGYLRIQPGERKKAAHASKHSFVYTLIKGSAIIQVENRTSTLQAGSFFFVPVGSQYSIRNDDRESQLILSYLRTETV